MGERPSRHDPFPWTSGGIGLQLEKRIQAEMSHEVLFEDEFTHLKDAPMFLGAALPHSRFFFAIGAALLIVGILLGRAFWMQVVQGNSYGALADNNRLRHEVITPKRGVIRDRNGSVLAENVPSFDLQVVPWLLPVDTVTREDLLARVGREAGMSLDTIDAEIADASAPTESLTLMRDLPYDRAVSLEIFLGEDPAIHVVSGSKRLYPESHDTTSLSHILGYVGSISPTQLAARENEGYRQVDLIGKTGIEASYESVLRGTPGERVSEVDAHNRVTSVVRDTPSVDGKDVYLTLDLNIQKAAEAALADELKKIHLTRGVGRGHGPAGWFHPRPRLPPGVRR